MTNRSGRKPKVAVFASGSGTNFEAVAAYAASCGAYEVALLVCDKPGAPVLARAERFAVPSYAAAPKSFASREAYEAELVRELERHSVEFVVLAGYMRLITPVLLRAYENRILNVHPSLLPAFPGLKAVEQALEYGARYTGVTVHFVDGGMDTGPIIDQESVRIEPGDTAETLYARVQRIEHRLYPAVVRAFAEERVRLEGRKVTLLLPDSAESPGVGPR